MLILLISSSNLILNHSSKTFTLTLCFLAMIYFVWFFLHPFLCHFVHGFSKLNEYSSDGFLIHFLNHFISLQTFRGPFRGALVWAMILALELESQYKKEKHKENTLASLYWFDSCYTWKACTSLKRKKMEWMVEVGWRVWEERKEGQETVIGLGKN